MVDSIGARRIRHRRRHLLAGLGAIVMLLWLGTGFAGAQEATPQCETEEDLYLWGDHGCELGLLPDASLQEMLLARGYDGSEADRETVIMALEELLLLEYEEYLAQMDELAANESGEDSGVVEGGEVLVEAAEEREEEVDAEGGDEEIEVHDLPHPWGYEGAPENEPSVTCKDEQARGSSDIQDDKSILDFILDLGKEVGTQMQRDAQVVAKLLPAPLQDVLSSGIKVAKSTVLPTVKDVVRYTGYFGRTCINSGRMILKVVGPKVQDSFSKASQALKKRIQNKDQSGGSSMQDSDEPISVFQAAEDTQPTETETGTVTDAEEDLES